VSRETARRVLRIEARALENLIERLDERFDRAVELLLACRGRVVVTGIGKSGLIGRKVAATFASTGTPSVFLHAADALHGDIGVLTREDVLLAISYGGASDEMVALLEAVKRLGIPVVALTGNPQSAVGAASDVVLDVSVPEEACPLNLAPTASTTATLAMGDALAVSLLERRGFDSDQFAALHPGGRLGKRLRRVEQLMHAGDAVPRVSPATPMPEVIYEMSRKGLGMTAVVADSDRIAGLITDGDLRRLMQQRGKETLELTAGECMTRSPVTIAKSELAVTALRLMEERKITSLLVVDEADHLAGVVHLHDLWTLQLF
jgi:arabinose-5-phosphate isomerase